MWWTRHPRMRRKKCQGVVVLSEGRLVLLSRDQD